MWFSCFFGETERDQLTQGEYLTKFKLEAQALFMGGCFCPTVPAQCKTEANQPPKLGKIRVKVIHYIINIVATSEVCCYAMIELVKRRRSLDRMDQ